MRKVFNNKNSCNIFLKWVVPTRIFRGLFHENYDEDHHLIKCMVYDSLKDNQTNIQLYTIYKTVFHHYTECPRKNDKQIPRNNVINVDFHQEILVAWGSDVPLISEIS